MNKKRILYWAVNVIIAIPAIVMMFANSILLVALGIYFGSIAVIGILYSRFEQWVYDVPKGYYINCSYRDTLKETFINEFKSITEGQYYVKSDS
jgi:hypothetical protein